jgi:hypothetical protein
VARLMEEISKVRPLKLFLIADGPNPDSIDDITRTKSALEEFRGAISWPCELNENISDINLGCGLRVSSGLDWVFRNVPEAIILEDDCISAEGFFSFCSEMLENFRENSDIGLISGSSFSHDSGSKSDFFVSRFANVWGWATWRRSWESYEFDIPSWPMDRAEIFRAGKITNLRSKLYWHLAFTSAKKRVIDTWDYQLVHMLWKNSQKVISSNANLVKNIGFDQEATNTIISKKSLNMGTAVLRAPIRWPPTLEVDEDRDQVTRKNQSEIGLVEFIVKQIFYKLPKNQRLKITKLLKTVFA